MSEEKRMIEIHYNAFDSIKLQIAKQKYKCKDVELFDKLKDSIIFLYVHNILTDDEENKCFNKLQKQIVKSIRKENKQ